MEKYLRYCFLICWLLNSVLTEAQSVPADYNVFKQKPDTAIVADFKKYPQEKTFIHTDLNSYLSGETIWYKIYATAYGKPSQLSKIVYIRLTDNTGQLVKQQKLPLINGIAHSNITLSDSLKTGWYELQAFTAWMLNFKEYSFYRQKIYIQNIHEKIAPALNAPVAKVYTISFYPEGGDLIDANVCHVAFKATDESGMPVKVQGIVMNNDNKIVTKFTTLHDGMGSFDLEAFANVTYIAQVHFSDHSVQNITLPKVKKMGILMQINDASADELEVKIASTSQQIQQNIMVEAVQSSGLVASYPLQLSRGINVFNFKKSGFTSGIVRLTVFNGNGIPAAERIVFINHHDQVKLSCSSDTFSFQPKSKNVLTLNLKDNTLNPFNGSFSVAVTDADISTEPENNICSYLLLSSELKGYIHQPAYYFTNNSDTLQKQLDLVMLTNGWRHFEWKSISSNQPLTLRYQPERAQFIAGKIENYQELNDKVVKLTITNADSTVYFLNVKPDRNGQFVLNNYDKIGGAKVFAEAVNKQNKQYPIKVSFYKSLVDSADIAINPSFTVNQSVPTISQALLDSINHEQKLKFIAKGILLKEVNIKTQRSSVTDLVIQTHVQRLSVDRVFDLDLINTPSFSTIDIVEYMRGRFPGLEIFGSRDSAKFVYRGTSSFLDRKNQCYFYIDEARVELQDITTISLFDIALIRFAPPPVWFAPLNGGNNGAILIYTKKHGDEKTAHLPSRKLFETYSFNGYSISRVFSSPDYSKPQLRNKPDYRTTLFWKPDVMPDENGNYKIQFYSSDNTKKIRLVVQGFTADGKLGYLNQVF
ncbi:MAG: hypothetical protein ACRYFB_09205 [Janthinobacterium lividum]